MLSGARCAVLALVLLSLPAAGSPGGLRVLTSRDPERTLFPSDSFTVPDFTQNTLLRVHLPRPDCKAQPVACEDIDVLTRSTASIPSRG